MDEFFSKIPIYESDDENVARDLAAIKRDPSLLYHLRLEKWLNIPRPAINEVLFLSVGLSPDLFAGLMRLREIRGPYLDRNPKFEKEGPSKLIEALDEFDLRQSIVLRNLKQQDSEETGALDYELVANQLVCRLEDYIEFAKAKKWTLSWVLEEPKENIGQSSSEEETVLRIPWRTKSLSQLASAIERVVEEYGPDFSKVDKVTIAEALAREVGHSPFSAGQKTSAGELTPKYNSIGVLFSPQTSEERSRAGLKQNSNS